MSSEIQNLSTALEGVAAGVAPSLVSVLSHRMQASGFVWRAGLVVTSDEGLAEEGEVRVVLPGGESTLARIVGRDASSAIALLRIERSDLQPVAMAATMPATGALILALGAEAGAPTAALGMVALSRGPWQSMRGGEIDARIELDVRLRSTAEGGLAVNAAGQAFGMTVFGPRRRVLVIPSVTIGRIAARLETHGRVPRGYLGLGLQPVTVEGGGSGIMVMSVDPERPRRGSRHSSGRRHRKLGRRDDRQTAAIAAIARDPAASESRWRSSSDAAANRTRPGFRSVRGQRLERPARTRSVTAGDRRG